MAASLLGLATGGANAMADPAELIGEWQVRSVSGPGSEAADIAKPGNVTFAEGRVHVRGSCNGLFGGFTAGADRIDFGDGLASTRMACPKDQMDSDRFVLAVLRGSAGYSVADGVVRIANGDRVVVLERATDSGGSQD